jgi:hydroxyacid-oxoacid transhydrogenase
MPTAAMMKPGVHLCHGMSYPVSGMVRNYQPAGYPTDHPLVPHGISVVLQAPAVFRFTAPACPERHLRAAQALGLDVTADDLPNIGERLAEGLVSLMRDLGLPSGLAAIGFTADDIPQLVAGTLPQHRVTKLSPRPASEDDLRQLFADSMQLW